LLLVPEFALASLSAVTESLRLLNRLAAETLYSWTLLAPDGARVCCNGGIDVGPCRPLDCDEDFATAFVVAGRDSVAYDDPRALAWLRRIAAHGCKLAGIGCGTFPIARAGLLDGYRCTTHWSQIDRLAAEFPKLRVSADLYCIDRDRFSSGGALAALDLMLALIAVDHGHDLAVGVADMMLHADIRPAAAQQRMSVRWRFGVQDKRLIRVISLMETHTAEPLALSELARRAAISLRQMERLFHQRFGRGPQEFYLELRLRRAQQLLTHTSEAVASIATQCGFSSASHLSRFYRRVFSTTPAAARRQTAPALQD
jgi:transcriptional regulator GlxA family with amidase domain